MERRGGTDLFPSEFCGVFEVDATGETNCAIWCIVEDEGEEVGEKSGLRCELVEMLFCVFS